MDTAPKAVEAKKPLRILPVCRDGYKTKMQQFKEHIYDQEGPALRSKDIPKTKLSKRIFTDDDKAKLRGWIIMALNASQTQTISYSNIRQRVRYMCLQKGMMHSRLL